MTVDASALQSQIDSLYAIAELAIGLAGFSSIVVFFKHREAERWKAADADRFHGLILHAMMALAFCLLPSFVLLFTDGPPDVWRIASGLLAVEIAFHATAIIRLTTIGMTVKAVVAVTGYAIMLLQGMNALGIVFVGEFRAYVVGVLYHVVQGGVVFISLIWLRQDVLERDIPD